jgi:hypothetical protein
VGRNEFDGPMVIAWRVDVSNDARIIDRNFYGVGTMSAREGFQGCVVRERSDRIDHLSTEK